MTSLCIDDASKAKVCEKLADRNEVRKSKQLPFRFLSAYLQLADAKTITRPYLIPSYFNLPCWATEAINILTMKRWHIQQKLDKIEGGMSWVQRRKCSRCKMNYTLAQNAKITGELEFKWPRYHIYHQKYVRVGLNEKDAMKYHDLKRMLMRIDKRIEALQPRAQQEKDMLYKALDKAEKSAEYQRERIARDNRRRAQRFKQLGIDLRQYLAPVFNALEGAAKQTAANIPGFDKGTRVLLASDTSGSMMGPVSKNSSVMCYHIGLLLSMLMKSRCPQAVTGMFGDIWKAYDMPSENILQNTIDMIKLEGEVGYSTNGYKVIDWLFEEGRVMDKVMLFTDCQLWDSLHGDASLAESWKVYKRMAPDAKLYLFDLAGYGQTPVSMKRGDVFCIAGWSDKVFDILAALERGNSAIDEIRLIVV